MKGVRCAITVLVPLLTQSAWWEAMTTAGATVGFALAVGLLATVVATSAHTGAPPNPNARWGPPCAGERSPGQLLHRASAL